MVRKYRKYTKELLEPIVKECVSIAGVLKKLDLKPSGGSQSHISRCIKKFGLDTSHFLGKATNCGPNKKGGPKKKHWKEILILRSNSLRQKAWKLRRAMIESGIKYKCVDCDNEGDWNGDPLMLQVDHKNGNWLDDRKENLNFRCPNCHSQTKGWCGSKGYAEVTSSAKYSRAYNESKKSGLRGSRTPTPITGR